LTRCLQTGQQATAAADALMVSTSELSKLYAAAPANATAMTETPKAVDDRVQTEQQQTAIIEQIQAAEAALSRATGQQTAAAANALAAASSELSQLHATELSKQNATELSKQNAAAAAKVQQDRQVVDEAEEFKSALQNKIAGGSMTPMELSILMVRWRCG
jgi:hypothetical protein